MDYRERQAKAGEDPRVQAVRSHHLVGRGTCTSVDECWENTELVDYFDRYGVTTPKAAVKEALEIEGIFLEKGLNASSGEPDCSLRAAYNEWQEKIKGG